MQILTKGVKGMGVVAVAISLSTPSASFASPIVLGATDSPGLGLASGFMQGYDFIPSTMQSLVALGFWDYLSDGLPGEFQVGLWETSSRTLLASAWLDDSDPVDSTLAVGNGNWRYETLASPVALTSAVRYTLAFQVGSEDLSVDDSLLPDFASLSINPDITLPSDGTRFLLTPSFTFPLNTFEQGFAFRGNVNAQVVPAAVPEPSTLLLLSVGLLSVAGYTRRRLKARDCE